MAYGNIYTAGFTSQTGNITGIVYIDKLDYTGSSSSLKISNVEVTHNFEGWDNHIIGMIASFTIINDDDDFFALMPLMLAVEKQYQVRIMAQYLQQVPFNLFQGFLNCEAVNQKYLHKQALNLVASCYLSKLDMDTIPTIEDASDPYIFMYAIDTILRSTGSAFNIYVNCSLEHTGSLRTYTNTNTCFNLTSFIPELYWEDNIKRKTNLEILTSILKSFSCYLYWYNGAWYIERYEDLFTGNAEYVRYNTPYIPYVQNYGVFVSVGKAYSDIHSLTMLEMSQTLSTIPGQRQITVNLKDLLLLNLINPDLSDPIILHQSTYLFENWIPRKMWVYEVTPSSTEEEAVWDALGVSYKNIANAAKRVGQVSFLDGGGRNMGTTFIATVDEETELTIKFKYATNPDPIFAGITWTGDWSDFDIRFTYSLYARVGILVYRIYIDEETGDTVADLLALTELPTETYMVQEFLIVNGAEFDTAKGSYEVVRTYNLEGLTALYGDMLFYFITGYERVKLATTTEWTYAGHPFNAWYGDFVVIANSILANNVIEGRANTDHLSRMEVDLDLFDVPNLNFRNAIIEEYPEGTITRTSTWTTRQNATPNPLCDFKLAGLWQLHNAVRLKLNVDVRINGYLQPFKLYYDSKQSNKKFLLAGFTYNILDDSYSCDFYEYDNTTAINLV